MNICHAGDGCDNTETGEGFLVSFCHSFCMPLTAVTHTRTLQPQDKDQNDLKVPKSFH